MGGQAAAGVSRHQEVGWRQMVPNHSQETSGAREGLCESDSNWRPLAQPTGQLSSLRTELYSSHTSVEQT